MMGYMRIRDDDMMKRNASDIRASSWNALRVARCCIYTTRESPFKQKGWT